MIALVAWEGLRASEVGVALGCSAPAAAMRLQRARRRLGAYLQLEDEGNRPPIFALSRPACICRFRNCSDIPGAKDASLRVYEMMGEPA